MNTKNEFLKTENLLLQEFNETWAQIRHLENLRSKYLGFFFTVILASVGFFINLMRDGIANNSIVVFGLFSLVWILFILTFLLYTAIKKMNVIIGHFGDCIRVIRRYFPNTEEIDKRISVREIKNAVMKHKIFSVHYTLELLLQLFCIIFLLIQFVGVILQIKNTCIVCWQTIVMILLLMISLIIYLKAKIIK